MTILRRVEPIYPSNRTRHSTDYPFVKHPQSLKKADTDKPTRKFQDELVISEEGRAWLESQKSKWLSTLRSKGGPYEKRQYREKNRKCHCQHPVHRRIGRFLGNNVLWDSENNPADYRTVDCTEVACGFAGTCSDCQLTCSYVLGLCVRANRLSEKK